MSEKVLKKKVSGLCLAAVLAVSQIGAVSVNPAFAATGSVSINKKNFPDEGFRTYVKQFDKNKDGKFSSAERNKVTELYVGGSKIKSVEGIEHFNELKAVTLDTKNVSSIDLSANKKLESFAANKLEKCKTINLKDLSFLESLSLFDTKQLKTLKVEGCTALKNLYLSKCPKITAFDTGKFANLESVSISDTGITSVNVRKNAKLTTLICGGKITKILTNEQNKKLLCVSVYGNTQIKNLDVSKLPKLNSLDLSYSNLALTKVKVKKKSQITALYVDHNKKNTALDLSGYTNLKMLDCRNAALSKLDLSKNKKLVDLYCSTNKLTSLDLKGLSKLAYVNCANNQLKELKISGNSGLKQLYCMSNKLESLGVSGAKQLEDISCNNNKLKKLDLSKNTKIVYVDSSDNKLSALNLSGLSKLKSVSCSNNQIKTLSVSGAAVLGTLNMQGNPIEVLDVSKTALDYIDCRIPTLKTLVAVYAGSKHFFCNKDTMFYMADATYDLAKKKGDGEGYYEQQDTVKTPVVWSDYMEEGEESADFLLQDQRDITVKGYSEAYIHVGGKSK